MGAETTTTKPGRQAERSEATRAKLLRAARELFAKRGYADVGTEEIVRRARVTRGALYHHFADKQDLFLAVHEELEEELTAQIGAALASGSAADPVEVLISAVGVFLDSCTDPARARITLIEAPSVLGWSKWREIDERYGLGLTMAALNASMEAGALRKQPVRPLAHLLIAALGEAGIVIAQAEDQDAARKEMEAALVALLDGLRA